MQKGNIEIYAFSLVSLLVIELLVMQDKTFKTYIPL